MLKRKKVEFEEKEKKKELGLSWEPESRKLDYCLFEMPSASPSWAREAGAR